MQYSGKFNRIPFDKNANSVIPVPYSVSVFVAYQFFQTRNYNRSIIIFYRFNNKGNRI